jgi:hypothetical protein
MGELRKIIEEEKPAEIEYFFLKDRNKISFDINDLNEFYHMPDDLLDKTVVQDYAFMTEDEYNSTVLANAGWKTHFSSYYDEDNPKRLVVLLSTRLYEESHKPLRSHGRRGFLFIRVCTWPHGRGQVCAYLATILSASAFVQHTSTSCPSDRSTLCA